MENKRWTDWVSRKEVDAVELGVDVGSSRRVLLRGWENGDNSTSIGTDSIWEKRIEVEWAWISALCIQETEEEDRGEEGDKAERWTNRCSSRSFPPPRNHQSRNSRPPYQLQLLFDRLRLRLCSWRRPKLMRSREKSQTEVSLATRLNRSFMNKVDSPPRARRDSWLQGDAVVMTL